MPGGTKGFCGRFRGGDGRLQRGYLQPQIRGRTGTKPTISWEKQPAFFFGASYLTYYGCFGRVL